MPLVELLLDLEVISMSCYSTVSLLNFSLKVHLFAMRDPNVAIIFDLPESRTLLISINRLGGLHREDVHFFSTIVRVDALFRIKHLYSRLIILDRYLVNVSRILEGLSVNSYVIEQVWVKRPL